MESIILEKLSEINEIVLNYDNRNKFSFGLFGGDIGQVVFLFYYSRLIDDDQNTIKAQEKIERVVNLINSSDNVSFSFCDGLSGILWGLEHLKRNDFIYYDDGDFSGCDSAMVKQMNKLIDYGLYDYLHESLGICLFLLTREKYTTEILNFVEKLDKIKIICDAYKGIG